MSKKILIILGCFCLALPILGGCGSKQTDQKTSAVEQTGEKTSAVGNEAEFNVYEDEYIENEDGTYTCRDVVFQYKNEVTGIEGENEVTYVVLTNNEDISFDTVRESLTSATMQEDEPDFVILGWY